MHWMNIDVFNRRDSMKQENKSRYKHKLNMLEPGIMICKVLGMLIIMGLIAWICKIYWLMSVCNVGVNRIEARHDTKNPASGNVMVKCGLKLEGIRRQADTDNTGICDTAGYAILRRDWSKN